MQPTTNNTYKELLTISTIVCVVLEDVRKSQHITQPSEDAGSKLSCQYPVSTEEQRIYDARPCCTEESPSKDFWDAVGIVDIENKDEIERLLRDANSFDVKTAKALHKAIERISRDNFDGDRIILRAQYDSVCETNKVFVVLLARSFRRARFDSMQAAFADIWDSEFDLGLFAIVTEYDE